MCVGGGLGLFQTGASTGPSESEVGWGEGESPTYSIGGGGARTWLRQDTYPLGQE